MFLITSTTLLRFWLYLIQVSVSRPGPGGGGLVKNITFHHVNVFATIQDMRKTLATAEELRLVRVSKAGRRSLCKVAALAVCCYVCICYVWFPNSVCMPKHNYELPVSLASPSVPVDTAVAMFTWTVYCCYLRLIFHILYNSWGSLVHSVPRTSEMTARVYLFR